MNSNARDDIFLIPHGENYVLFAPIENKAFLINVAAAVEILSSLNEKTPSDIEQLLQDDGIELVGSKAESFEPDQSQAYKPTSVTLFPTSDCNLACVYCFASAGDKNKDKLDIKIAKPAIDTALANALETGKDARVSFHGGGEPFFNFNLVKASVEYAKKRAKEIGVNVIFTTATNGILNNEMRRWIVENIDAVALSFDGPGEAQNINRPTTSGRSTFPIVDATIRYFEEHSQQYSIRVTTTSHNVAQLDELTDYIVSNTSLRSVQIEPVANQGRAKDNLDCAIDPELFTDEFIKARKYARSRALRLHYSGAALASRRQFFCGAHYDNFFITPQGKVSTCIEASNEGDVGSEIYHIGSVGETGSVINEEKLKFLRSRTVSKLPGCNDCFAKFHCAGDCSYKQYSAHGDFYATGDDPRCQINRAVLLDEIVQQIPV